MVRAIAGTLIEVAAGRRSADAMSGILAARDRRAAGRTAPARGLTLVSVSYDPARGEELE
jgi:tRNA pseudouridine38-40 synthase